MFIHAYKQRILNICYREREKERERERKREIPSTFILKFFALTSVVNMLLVLGDQRVGVT